MIGGQRCGTTWLYEQFKSHPEIYVPEHRKEMHFFTKNYEKGFDWYSSYFLKDENTTATQGEITPDYLFNVQAAQRIQNDLPDAKLIALLRQPTDRAYSQYAYYLRNQPKMPSFEEFCAADPRVLQKGDYAKLLEKYEVYRTKGQLLIIIFEELMANKEQGLMEIAEFLGVRSDWCVETVGVQTNESTVPQNQLLFYLLRQLGKAVRSRGGDKIVENAKSSVVGLIFKNRKKLPPLDYATRQRFDHYYRDRIHALESKLGRNIDCWRREGRLSHRD